MDRVVVAAPAERVALAVKAVAGDDPAARLRAVPVAKAANRPLSKIQKNNFTAQNAKKNPRFVFSQRSQRPLR